MLGLDQGTILVLRFSSSFELESILPYHLFFQCMKKNSNLKMPLKIMVLILKTGSVGLIFKSRVFLNCKVT